MKRSILVVLALGSACGSPALGDRPALCSDGACPASYTCIAGVCTTPGDDVPLTITTSGTLRGVDLRILAGDSTALVVWQTYAYAPEGEGFLGARIDGQGNVSETMQLVTSFAADPGALEPYYDVAPTKDGLLLAVAASPLADDDDPRPRLLVYRVDLPPEGDEMRGATFASAWPAEERLDTVGYGAVSKPRFAGSEKAFSLGYLQSLTTTDAMTMTGATKAELVVYPLGGDGSMLDAPAIFDARSSLGLPVAVGVEGAWSFDDASWWVLDDARPSVLRIDHSTGESQELALASLGIAESATSSELRYIAPSRREGEQLPTDPVSGAASLHAVAEKSALADTMIADMPTTRDTPKPIVVATSTGDLLVSPGESATSETISVSGFDDGVLTPKLMIHRASTNPLEAVAATVVGDVLYVAWAEVGPGLVTVRAKAVAVP